MPWPGKPQLPAHRSVSDMLIEPKPANQTKAVDWPLDGTEHQKFKSWFNLLG
jgi:hypothetical protein